MSDNRETILIADDEKVNIAILVELLDGEYQIEVARNGSDALNMAQLEPSPDLILLDVRMPDMNGYEVCRQLKKNPKTRAIPVIFITSMNEGEDETKAFELGAVDYLTKPISPAVVLARVRTHLALKNQSQSLEKQVHERTAELETTRDALREAMQNLLTVQVTPGVFWVQIPEAGLYILCGCPGEVTKHLMRKGFIKTIKQQGVTCESGPNVILFSDLMVQNGGFANLAEFPVLQMLYRQGMIIPGHPNNTGVKPMLIGSAEQVQAQLKYIYRGNYGLISKQEIMEGGCLDETEADLLMRVKLNFAFGSIRSSTDFVDTLVVTEDSKEIRNGVSVKRTGFNRFEFSFRGKTTTVDLNLPPDVVYEQPYRLGSYWFERHYFAVLHAGDGDGWDEHRPSMGSVLMFQGRVFLIDAGPGVLHSLTALGIDVSEVEGIFHTHCHDDHFAGLPALIRSGHRLKYYATPLVRASVMKKFSALMSLGESTFNHFFEIHDLKFAEWNNCSGLEVMPIYSPHPVENNLFVFRALDTDGYKTYAHWADLSSFKVLDRMTEGPNALPVEWLDKIKQDYLQAVTLKKLDIGGGMIHGQAEDFRKDCSERLVLSHINRKLTLKEMEIGSEAAFGALDILIEGDQDYARQHAFNYLSRLLPSLNESQFRILLNCPVVSHNAGTIIRRGEAQIDYMDMVLSGTVAYIDSSVRVHNKLSFGSFIGDRALFDENAASDEGTYRAVSYCRTLRVPNMLMREFLRNNELFDYMREITDKIWFLRKTWLFGEQTTFLSLERIARNLKQENLADGSMVPSMGGSVLWLVGENSVVLWQNGVGKTLHRFESGDFFGEHAYSGMTYRTLGDACLLRVNLSHLKNIPIVSWKLLEVINKRQKLL